MSAFLIKSEPTVYGFDRLVEDGRTRWDGVRNFQARNNLRAMKKGDLCLFYHSNEGKAVVGVARVVREAYADPTVAGDEGDWSAVDVAPEYALAEPVTLAAIKAHPKLAAMQIVTRPRLSVSPVTDAEFDLIVKLGGGPAKARRAR